MRRKQRTYRKMPFGTTPALTAPADARRYRRRQPIGRMTVERTLGRARIPIAPASSRPTEVNS